jgi:endonuclease/exonuclease/phosphatase family metal-dependent hydrolase
VRRRPCLGLEINKGNLKILNVIIFPITLLVGLALTASGLTMFIHPRYSEWLPLLGLAFPALFVINLIFILYWWIQLKLKLIIPLCFAIFNLIHASKYVQYTRKNVQSKNDFVVATYNAQLFGAMDNSNSFNEVRDRLAKDSFHILCLQEVFSQTELKARILELKKAGNYKMYSFFRQNPDRPYGMAVLSKLRIVNSGKVGMGNNTGNMAIYVDVIMETDTVRVYNVHLQSIRFQRSDYKFIQQPDNAADGLEGSKNLLRRLKEAYPKRADQADSLANHIKSCPFPLLVTGDLNDVPLSYAYYKVSKGLLDAFREKGKGFEQTYKGPFPNFRIDYILYSKPFTCTSYNSYSDIAGDHKLVKAAFTFGLPSK